MSMSGYYNIGAGSEAESIRTIHRALDLGVTHIDTAEIYGPFAGRWTFLPGWLAYGEGEEKEASDSGSRS